MTRDWTAAFAAKRKQRKGESLTPAESTSLKEYVAWNNSRASRIYWTSPEELEEMKAQAQAEGVGRFSDWCVQMIRMASQGEAIDPRIVSELTTQVADLRRRVEEQKDETLQYRDEAREWSVRYRGLADELALRASEKIAKEKSDGV